MLKHPHPKLKFVDEDLYSFGLLLCQNLRQVEGLAWKYFQMKWSYPWKIYNSLVDCDSCLESEGFDGS